MLQYLWKIFFCYCRTLFGASSTGLYQWLPIYRHTWMSMSSVQMNGSFIVNRGIVYVEYGIWWYTFDWVVNSLSSDFSSCTRYQIVKKQIQKLLVWQNKIQQSFNDYMIAWPPQPPFVLVQCHRSMEEMDQEMQKTGLHFRPVAPGAKWKMWKEDYHQKGQGSSMTSLLAVCRLVYGFLFSVLSIPQNSEHLQSTIFQSGEIVLLKFILQRLVSW